MALFYRFVASSMVTSFEVSEIRKLIPYSVIFFFSIDVLLSNFLFNYLIMKRPFDGKHLSFKDYAKGSLWGSSYRYHWRYDLEYWYVYEFFASGEARFAISYRFSQGATLIAALWGVFIRKEFKGATKLVNTLVFFMFLAYLTGLALTVYARE